MQTTDNEIIQTEPQEAEQTVPTMRKTIGGTTYIVKAHFSKTSKDTMEDKICRLIRRDIEGGNI